MTSFGNDYGYEKLFARQIQAQGQRDDVLIGYSTSGKSPHKLLTLEEARAKGILSIGFTGNPGGPMKNLCELLLEVLSADTPKIQEGNLVLGHFLCRLVENEIFKVYS